MKTKQTESSERTTVCDVELLIDGLKGETWKEYLACISIRGQFRTAILGDRVKRVQPALPLGLVGTRHSLRRALLFSGRQYTNRAKLQSCVASPERLWEDRLAKLRWRAWPESDHDRLRH